MAWRPFPFLCLPAELRNYIYREVLIEKDEFHEYFDGCFVKRFNLLSQPPLTRTSRQIRQEALPIFYGENEIWVDLPEIQRLTNDSICVSAAELADVFSSTLRLTSNLRIVFHGLHVRFSTPTQRGIVHEEKESHLYIRDDEAFHIESQCGCPFCSLTKTPYYPIPTIAERIGDDEVDWSNKQAVENALDEALDINEITGYWYEDCCSFESCLLEVLWILAEKHPAATKSLFYTKDDDEDWVWFDMFDYCHPWECRLHITKACKHTAELY